MIRLLHDEDSETGALYVNGELVCYDDCGFSLPEPVLKALRVSGVHVEETNDFFLGKEDAEDVDVAHTWAEIVYFRENRGAFENAKQRREIERQIAEARDLERMYQEKIRDLEAQL